MATEIELLKAQLAELAGRIILVGATAPGLMDLRATPLDSAIPGVEIHQQIIEQVVAGRYLTRPDYAPGIEWLTAMLAVLIIAAVALRAPASVTAALGLLVIGALLAVGQLLFSSAGYLFDPVFPAACVFVFAASASTYLYRRAEMQRAEIRRAYVTSIVRRRLWSRRSTARPRRRHSTSRCSASCLARRCSRTSPGMC